MTIRQNLCLFQGRGQGDRRGNERERERCGMERGFQGKEHLYCSNLNPTVLEP